MSHSQYFMLCFSSQKKFRRVHMLDSDDEGEGGEPPGGGHVEPSPVTPHTTDDVDDIAGVSLRVCIRIQYSRLD